ncbi:ABC transporter permease [Stackebrandtia soli]|uniref:ABC transporter permease n=1 Tax=Stackebrandtia soli TaxID=1892856 RepID=UPI0039E87616
MSILAAEWLKFRSVRSTHYLLAATAALFIVCTVIASAMVADWRGSSAADQATFAAADVTIPLIPFAQYLIAVIAAMVMTSEYATGSIHTTLMAVPNRRRLYGSKLAVVVGATLVLAAVLSVAAILVTDLVTADLPAPIRPWETVSSAFALTVANIAVMVVIAVTAFGFAALTRSLAGTQVIMTLLLLILPILAMFLPAPVGLWAHDLALPSLPAQLAGVAVDSRLTPETAAVAAVGWAVVSAGAGLTAFIRRDA